MPKKKKVQYILPLKKSAQHLRLVGRTAQTMAGLMHAKQKGVRIADGFVLTTRSFEEVILEEKRRKALKETAASVNGAGKQELRSAAGAMRKLVGKSALGKEAEAALLRAYKKLAKKHGKAVCVQVSLLGQDGTLHHPTAFFPRMFALRTERTLVQAVNRLYQSYFSDDAFLWRVQHAQDHLGFRLAIIVQPTIDTSKSVSGEVRVDPVHCSEGRIHITSAYGIEGWAQDTHDRFEVFADGLRRGKEAVIEHRFGAQTQRRVLKKRGTVSAASVPKKKQQQFTLTDKQVVTLAQAAAAFHAEDRRALRLRWGFLAEKGQFVITDISFISAPQQRLMTSATLKHTGERLFSGKAGAYGIGAGVLRIVAKQADWERVKSTDVVFLQAASLKGIRPVSAIIVPKKRATAQVRAYAQEQRIPLCVASKEAKEKLKDGLPVTVSVDVSGAVVYAGLLPYETTVLDATALPKTHTRLSVMLSDAAHSAAVAALPADEIGVLKMEDLVMARLQAHPLAYAKPKAVSGAKKKAAMKKEGVPFGGARPFAVETLAAGIAQVAAAAYPRPVTVQLTQYVDRPYADMPCAPSEAKAPAADQAEAYTKGYRAAVAVEAEAVLKARQQWGLENIQVMVPACQTPVEAQAVVSFLEELGLKRGDNGLKLSLAYGIPGNMSATKSFGALFDAISIDIEDILAHVLETQPPARFLQKRKKEQGVEQLVKSVVADAAKHIDVRVRGEFSQVAPSVIDRLLQAGVSQLTIMPHDLVPVKQQLAKSEQLHGPAARRQSKRYMGILAAFTFFSMSLLGVGSGCTEMFTEGANPAEEGSYVTPAQMRSALEDKMRTEMKEAVQDFQTSLQRYHQLPPLRVSIPEEWQQTHYPDQVRFVSPTESNFFLIKVENEDPNVIAGEPVEAVLVDGIAGSRYAVDEEGVERVILEMPDGPRILLQGSEPHFDDFLDRIDFLDEEEAEETVAPEETVCAQVITYARASSAEQCTPFPTPCDVPEGWEAC